MKVDLVIECDSKEEWHYIFIKRKGKKLKIGSYKKGRSIRIRIETGKSKDLSKVTLE